MVRGVILIAAIAVVVSVMLYFNAQQPLLVKGFWRMSHSLDELLILGAIGLAAAQLPSSLCWATVGVALLSAIASAWLTMNNILELNQLSVAVMIALLALGVIGATGGQLAHYLSPFAALAALLVGHVATDTAGQANTMFLLGFGLAVCVVMALGAAIAEITETWEGGAAKRLAAAIGGIGAYKLALQFLM